jgi:hypothetical protein
MMNVSSMLQPLGSSDASALALAALVHRVGRVFDATLPDWAAPAAIQWTVSRGDYREPILRHAVVGRVALAAEYELQDGIAGPRDVFVRFLASLRDLPPGRQVIVDWNGAMRVDATVHGPTALEAEARQRLEGARVVFVAT